MSTILTAISIAADPRQITPQKIANLSKPAVVLTSPFGIKVPPIMGPTKSPNPPKTKKKDKYEEMSCPPNNWPMMGGKSAIGTPVAHDHNTTKAIETDDVFVGIHMANGNVG